MRDHIETRTAPVAVAIATLDERVWQKWLQVNREREAKTDLHSTAFMAVVPLLAALWWFFIRP